MSTNSNSGSLRERLRAESQARMREVAEKAARRIASESEARSWDAVGQTTADLAHQAERVERAARRLIWLRAGTVMLALLAGGVGGAVAVWLLLWVG
jgi:hypothetical protein